MRLFVIKGPCAEMVRDSIKGSVVVTSLADIESYTEKLMICIISKLPSIRRDDIMLVPSFEHWCSCAGERICISKRNYHASVMLQLAMCRHLRPRVLYVSGGCQDPVEKSLLIDQLKATIG
jgi:hypothetical protein